MSAEAPHLHQRQTQVVDSDRGCEVGEAQIESHDEKESPSNEKNEPITQCTTYLRAQRRDPDSSSKINDVGSDSGSKSADTGRVLAESGRIKSEESCSEEVRLLEAKPDDEDMLDLREAASKASLKADDFRRWTESDVFGFLKAQRQAQAPVEVDFSPENPSEKWLVAFLVATLYIMFYVAGGLAYYLVECRGYTVGYPGYLNWTDALKHDATPGT